MLLWAGRSQAAGPPPRQSVNGEHLTDVPNLSLLTAGVIPPNPAELLASKQVPGVLTQLAEGHDLVVIDTPPVDAVTDALGLAAVADATIIVIKAGGSVRRAQTTIDALRLVGANVVGVVINRAKDKAGEGYYYYYEGYSATAAPPAVNGNGMGNAQPISDALGSWTPISKPKRSPSEQRSEIHSE
jgi:Mrp family chromosome partitioning ATPase